MTLSQSRTSLDRNRNYGTASDPMVGQKIGGVNVFGGGLALYGSSHVLVGGVGVSGDTSCADHNIAWRVRNLLGLDHMAATGSLPGVGGVTGDRAHPDNIIFDITPNPNGGTGTAKVVSVIPPVSTLPIRPRSRPFNLNR